MFSSFRNRFGIPGVIAMVVFVLVLPAAAPAAPLGSLTSYPPGSTPRTITAGPDGNLWFTGLGPAAVSRITPAGVVTPFSAGLATGSSPGSIAPGPDGNLWFADNGTSRQIGRITPAGTITEFSTGLSGGMRKSIAPDSDGNLWFTTEAGNEQQKIEFTGFVEGNTFTLTFDTQTTAPITFSTTSTTLRNNIDAALEALSNVGAGNIPTPSGTAASGVTVTFSGTLASINQPLMSCAPVVSSGTCVVKPVNDGGPAALGRITPAGAVTEFSAGLNGGAKPVSIAPGPDGNLWFTDQGTTKAIGRITPSGTITEFDAGLNAEANPSTIAPGPDGNLWFTDQGTTKAIGRITPSGTITEFDAGLNAEANPSTIAPGPDGNLWFTDQGTTKAIGRITPSGTITEFAVGAGSEPGSITPGSDGNLWFVDNGVSPAIWRFGVGAQAPNLRLPSVNGTAQVGTQQVCGDDRWATWAGIQPEDGGLLASSTSPAAVQWLLDGAPIGGATNRTYTPVAGDLGKSLSCTTNVTYRLPLNVTTPATSTPVSVISQSSGPTGPTGPAGGSGATGPAGPAGQAGAAGTQGPVGAAGKEGTQGPVGAAGKDAKVTCIVKKKGTKVKVTCKVTMATASSSKLRWRLMRKGHAVARGAVKPRHRRASLRLDVSALERGHYHLHLQGRKGATTIVVS